MSNVKLIYAGGAEGPKHDPYQWNEHIVIRDGVRHVLRVGALGYTRYVRNGQKVIEGYDKVALDDGSDGACYARKAWEDACGMTLGRFWRTWRRLERDQIEDPMGSIGDYA